MADSDDDLKQGVQPEPSEPGYIADLPDVGVVEVLVGGEGDPVQGPPDLMERLEGSITEPDDRVPNPRARLPLQ